MLNSKTRPASAGSGLARARVAARVITSAVLALMSSAPRVQAVEAAPAVVTIVAMDPQASESGGMWPRCS